MILRDWHYLPEEVLRPLYLAESRRWRDELAWDTHESWATVEVARTTWGLPGLVCLDQIGNIRGWTFYMTAGGRVDVGGLSADSPEATAALVDALIARAGSAQQLQGLLYDCAPDLTAVMARRGVRLVPYVYRMRPLAEGSVTGGAQALRLLSQEGSTLRGWSETDIDDAGDLLRGAHDERTGPLVPGATREDWSEYVRNLVVHGGCGTVSAAESRVLRLHDRLAAVALVSVIAPETAHLVQFAVRRDLQGRGLGRALLAATLDAATAAGHTAMSLLVSAENRPALRLYQDAGFVVRGTFVSLRPAVADARAATSVASRIA